MIRAASAPGPGLLGGQRRGTFAALSYHCITMICYLIEYIA